VTECQKAESRLVAFLVGEVSARESAWLAEHVRRCPPCQEELASLNLTVEVLRRLPREDVSAEFDRKLALRIAERAPEGAGSARRRRRLPWTGLAAAVALALLALIPFASHGPRPERRRASLTGTPPPLRVARVQPPPAAPAAAEAPAPHRDVAAARTPPPAPTSARPAAAAPAPAAVIGRVLRVSGAPRVALGKGRPAAVREGMTLRAGAVLTTGDTGQAEVQFAGGSRARLDFDTSVTFAAAPVSGRKVQDVVHLASGRLYLLVPRSQRGLTVQTPHARVEALGPISAISVVPAGRLDRSGPGLHLELTTATAVRGRVRLASSYGSVIAEEGGSAQAVAAEAPSLVPGMAHLASVRAQTPWGQTLFEVWVADRLELDEALRWATTDDDAALHAANRLLADGWVAGARQQYQRLAEARPDDVAAFSNLGLASELEGDVAGALAAYRRAAELAPRSARYQHNLGMAYLRIGNLQRACAHLAAALEVGPDLPDTRFQLGRALSVLGDLDGAAHQAELLEAAPETAAKGLCLRGDLQWLQGDIAGAEDWYWRALQQDPDCVLALTYLAGTAFLQGRLDDARAWSEQALSLEPTSLRALNRLGLVLIAQGDFAAAREALWRAEQAHPGSGVVHSNIGLAYYREGRFPEAVDAYRHAVSLSPDSVLCHMGLAMALEANGEVPEAQHEYETVLQLDPTYEEAADRLANLLEREGSAQQARRVHMAVAQYRE
jgi:tetratricopeptide (TPR) repeat protein